MVTTTISYQIICKYIYIYIYDIQINTIHTDSILLHKFLGLMILCWLCSRPSNSLRLRLSQWLQWLQCRFYIRQHLSTWQRGVSFQSQRSLGDFRGKFHKIQGYPGRFPGYPGRGTATFQFLHVEAANWSHHVTRCHNHDGLTVQSAGQIWPRDFPTQPNSQTSVEVAEQCVQ